MITSNECWLKGICPKYIKNENSECKDNDVFCTKLFKLDFLYKESNLPDNQREHKELRLDQSKVDKKVFESLKNIENSISSFVSGGNNLYIFSSITGNGKTSWAVRLMQEFFNTIWPESDLVCRGLFISVPRYLLSLKQNIQQKSDYLERINNRVYSADLVIWDDIGTKVATSFEHENLLSIIDYRMTCNLSNIFTSNLSPDLLKDFAGDRLFSRIIYNSTCIEFKGLDKRGLNK